ncbi:hypothetical protein Zm00014a_027745 [Zea mays]|uniref:Uncharacterized protein n=1 Tax=Zea mays TaxID=4577 RepID=A0A3L6FXX6_MAIZE|nr:hypothetical protein Zm00014a_027745 [Zea mays]
MAPQCGTDGRYSSVRRASRSLQLIPATRKMGWKLLALTEHGFLIDAPGDEEERAAGAAAETAAAEVEN